MGTTGHNELRSPWKCISTMFCPCCSGGFHEKQIGKPPLLSYDGCLKTLTLHMYISAGVNMWKCLLRNGSHFVQAFSSLLTRPLTPGRSEWKLRKIISKLTWVIDGWGILWNALKWMSLNQTDNSDKSTSVQVMAWCCQATNHYLDQCWPRSLLPYWVTRPRWVNVLGVTHIHLSSGIEWKLHDCITIFVNMAYMNWSDSRNFGDKGHKQAAGWESKNEKIISLGQDFHPSAHLAKGVLWLPASVCPSVMLSIHCLRFANLLHWFKRESPNLNQTCNLASF